MIESSGVSSVSEDAMETGESSIGRDQVVMRASSSLSAAKVSTLETEPFIENGRENKGRDDAIDVHPVRCRPRGVMVASLLLFVTAAIFASMISSSSSTPLPSTTSQSDDPTKPIIPHYSWNGKKCFETKEELWVAVDSYLLDRNNATIESVYGLPIGKWCVKYVEDFAFTFSMEGRDIAFPERADELKNLVQRFNDDISTWDVTGAKSLDRMFRGSKEFNQDLSKWDVSRVESMRGTFELTLQFDGDIRLWDVSKVKVFAAMFYGTQGFGRNIAYWNVSSAEDMTSMFRNAKGFNQDLCPWAQYVKPTTTSRGMFMNSGCPTETMVGPFFGDDPRWSKPGPFCHSCD